MKQRYVRMSKPGESLSRPQIDVEQQQRACDALCFRSLHATRICTRCIVFVCWLSGEQQCERCPLPAQAIQAQSFVFVEFT